MERTILLKIQIVDTDLKIILLDCQNILIARLLSAALLIMLEFST